MNAQAITDIVQSLALIILLAMILRFMARP